MKKIKKILSLLCAAVVLFTLTITAFAANNTANNASQSNSQNASDRQQKRSEQLDKKLQYLQFKQSLDQKTAAIKDNRTQNRSLLIQNTQLRKDILASLTAIKENGSTVSQDVQNQLKAYNQQIKDITSALKDSKGSIKDILTANKENIKNMDYEAVDSAFDQVSSIQNNRNEQLQKINDILQRMKSLLQTTV